MRTTLADLKASRIPSSLKMCSTDNRVRQLANEAIQRLIMGPEKWWGTYQRYQCCVTNGCLTWPRHFAAIESVWKCGWPVTIRNEWFESLPMGVGLQNELCGDGSSMIDRGTACAFEDVSGTNKKIKVYADVTEAADARILLQGWDENGNWIRTEDNGAWVDGEYVAISTTPQITTKKFSALTGVQKPDTNGVVRLYQYNVDTAVQSAIAYYEWDENNPVYRRSLIPGISLNPSCSGGCGQSNQDDEACQKTTVVVEAKLEFIPAKRDSDWLLIGNLGALKAMCRAILFEEEGDAQSIAKARALEALARQILQNEIEHYNGTGVVIPLRIEGETWGAGDIENVI